VTRRLSGRITVELPPAEAFRLFTPQGEREWVDGWEPRFPSPVADDTEPGVVFETAGHEGHGPTIWLVLERRPGARIAYARVTPEHSAGTVTVEITGGRDGGSEVEVTYALTPLTAAAEPLLAEFAEHYPHFLRSWQDAIATVTSADRNPGDHRSSPA
jgi:hypothetical protein